MVDIDSILFFGTVSHELQSDHPGVKKKLFSLRQAVNDLFFQGHVSKTQIARQKKVSRNFVIRWTRSRGQDCMRDDRGWPRGKRRKWDQTTVRRIMVIHERLVQDPSEFYIGATVIVQQWRKLYPGSSPPPLRTIGRILAELGLSAPRKEGRSKGAARYLCYPEHTIYEGFGGRVLEADFVGRKYLKERTEPLNFIGYSFKKAPRLRYFKRIEGQTADNFIIQTRVFFDSFETPDYIKMDNTVATIGSASGARNISRAMCFLLEHQVVPIFTVPHKPFSQASIEGNNSVFARKFWNRREFRDLADVDEQLTWFNQASQRYLEYQPPSRKKRRSRNFIPRVYFIRQVREQDKTGFIEVLHTTINLPRSYINYFVLAEWNLLEEHLYIHFEKDLQSRMIKKLTFRINPRSYDKHQHLLAN